MRLLVDLRVVSGWRLMESDPVDENILIKLLVIIGESKHEQMWGFHASNLLLSTQVEVATITLVWTCSLCPQTGILGRTPWVAI